MENTQKEAGFTPGPWSNTPMQDTIWANDGETKIATISDLPWVENPVTGKRSSDWQTEQANARLIAAAPELLEACSEVLRMLELLNAPSTNDPIEACVYKAKSAIAKATGKDRQ